MKMNRTKNRKWSIACHSKWWAARIYCGFYGPIIKIYWNLVRFFVVALSHSKRWMVTKLKTCRQTVVVAGYFFLILFQFEMRLKSDLLIHACYNMCQNLRLISKASTIQHFDFYPAVRSIRLKISVFASSCCSHCLPSDAHNARIFMTCVLRIGIFNAINIFVFQFWTYATMKPIGSTMEREQCSTKSSHFGLRRKNTVGSFFVSKRKKVVFCSRSEFVFFFAHLLQL